jgi:hypothetical protein
MDRSRTILVLSSCTGRKVIDARSSTARAERLYVGEQHRRLMLGVNAFRAADCGYEIDLRILSAGFGMVAGSRRLPLYDRSFAGLEGEAIDERSAEVGIPGAVARILSRDYALAILLLGEDYMRAAAIGPTTRFGGPAIAFGGAALSRRSASLPLRVVPATKSEARRFSCGLVGLKGEMGGRLLALLSGEPSLITELPDSDIDMLGMLDRVSIRSLEIAA